MQKWARKATEATASDGGWGGLFLHPIYRERLLLCGIVFAHLFASILYGLTPGHSLPPSPQLCLFTRLTTLWGLGPGDTNPLPLPLLLFLLQSAQNGQNAQTKLVHTNP